MDRWWLTQPITLGVKGNLPVFRPWDSIEPDEQCSWNNIRNNVETEWSTKGAKALLNLTRASWHCQKSHTFKSSNGDYKSSLILLSIKYAIADNTMYTANRTSSLGLPSLAGAMSFCCRDIWDALWPSVVCIRRAWLDWNNFNNGNRSMVNTIYLCRRQK